MDPEKDAKGNDPTINLADDFGMVIDDDAPAGKGGESAAAPSAPQPDDDGNVSTIELAEYGKDIQEGKTSDAQPQKGLSLDGQVDFDKIPRFKELIETQTELRGTITQQANTIANLQGQIQTMLSMGGSGGKGAQQQQEQIPDYFAMSADELRENLAENPKDVLLAVANVTYQKAVNDINANLQRGSTANAVEGTYAGFEKDNPGFTKAWDDGSIKAFMKDNPGHNAISAYMILTQHDRDEAIKEKAKADLIKEIRAKGNINSLGPGPHRAPAELHNTNDMLRNPDRYGGTDAVLYQRYLARQAAKQV